MWNDETTLGSPETGKGLRWDLCPWEGRSGKVRNNQVRIKYSLEASPEGRESFVKNVSMKGDSVKPLRDPGMGEVTMWAVKSAETLGSSF